MIDCEKLFEFDKGVKRVNIIYQYYLQTGYVMLSAYVHTLVLKYTIQRRI